MIITKYRDSDGTNISVNYIKNNSIVEISITDAYGRSTNSIQIPANKAKRVAMRIEDFVADLEDQSNNYNRLHDQITESKIDVLEWRTSIEQALGVESGETNHTPEWAYNRFLEMREIGNKK